jgi:hypothetical protein
VKKPVSKFCLSKCNLQRYIVDDRKQAIYLSAIVVALFMVMVGPPVGLCRLNQVDPWPITYSFSNP